MASRDASVLEKRDEVAPPRGVLYPQRRSELGSLVRVPPSPDLAPFVAHYWIITWDLRGNAPQLQETLPHPSVHIALERGRSAIYGVVKGRFTRIIEGKGRVFGIKFRPGGYYPFARYPISRLTNRVVPLDDDTLEKTLLAKRSERAMVEVAESYLLGQNPKRDPAAEKIGDIVEQIAVDRSIGTVETLAQKTAIGTRSLQRLFSRYIGVSPKWVINRNRLHEVIERLSQGETIDWTRLALDLGYFDQAHFIKDFKSIIGRTPSDYRNR